MLLVSLLAEITVDLDSMGWVVFVSLLIPVVVELLTRARASTRVKGALALVASAVVAFVELVTDSGGVVADEALLTFGVVFLIQLASYLGIYKPLGLPGSIAPTKGIGAPKA